MKVAKDSIGGNGKSSVVEVQTTAITSMCRQIQPHSLKALHSHYLVIATSV